MNRKLKLSLYLAAIFAAGVVTGMFISYQVVRHMMPSRERMASRWAGELQSKLDLTPEQMQKVRPVIDEVLANFKGNLSQEMLGSLSNCYARVALDLTSVQKEKLQQLEQEQARFIRTQFGGEYTASKE